MGKQAVSKGSPGLRLSLEPSGPRPELGKVWSLLRVWPLWLDTGVGVLGEEGKQQTRRNLSPGGPGPALSSG